VNVAGGKIKVPSGNYGLFGVSLSAKTQNGEEITADGAAMNTNQVLSAVAGRTNTLVCGAPLKIEVTTERQGRRSNWFAKLFSSGTDELRIQARIVGAGGETYVGFSLSGERGERQPPRPAFTIVTADGRLVASGNLEFG
jgi:hypothetical protein